MTTFEKVKALSKALRLPLCEIEKQAGLGAGSISHWRTVSPSVNNLQKVAVLLGVTVNDLVGDVDEH